MRRVVPAFLAFCASIALASAARADEPPPPLEQAARIEQEAQEHLNAGRCAEGARLMAKAWMIRAEVWGRAQDGPRGKPPGGEPQRGEPRRGEPRPPRPGIPPLVDPPPRPPEMRRPGEGPDRREMEQKIERLKAMSNEAEKAGHAAKEAGNEDLAREKMEESGRLWRKATELEEQARRGGERGPGKGPGPGPGQGPGPDGDERAAKFAEAKERLHRLRAEAQEQEAAAKKFAAEGKEGDAKEMMERARANGEKARALAERLERATAEGQGDAARPPKPPAPPQDEMAAAMRRLRAALEDLRAQVEAMRQKLEERGR